MSCEASFSQALFNSHRVNIDQTARLYRANDEAVLSADDDDDDWHYCDARVEISSGIGSDSVLGVYCIT